MVNLSAPVRSTLLKKAQATALSISSLTGNPISRFPLTENVIAKTALMAIGLTNIRRTSTNGSNRARKKAANIDTRSIFNIEDILLRLRLC